MDEMRIIAAVATLGLLIGGGFLVGRSGKASEGAPRKARIAGIVLLGLSLVAFGLTVYANIEANGRARRLANTQLERIDLVDQFPTVPLAEIDLFLFLKHNEKPYLEESVTLEGFKELRISDLLMWRGPVPNYGRLPEIRRAVIELHQYMIGLGYQAQEETPNEIRVLLEVPNSSVQSFVELVVGGYKK